MTNYGDEYDRAVDHAVNLMQDGSTWSEVKYEIEAGFDLPRGDAEEVLHDALRKLSGKLQNF